MDKLQSVHVTGSLAQAADKTTASGITSVKVDISFDRKGNCSGTIQAEGLGSVTVIRSPELLHIKGDADFWRNIARQRHATPKQENVLVGTFAARWMKMPRSNPQSAQMAAVCDQMDAVTGIGASAVEVRKDGISLIDGKTAVAVSAKTDEGTEETYWIATQGTPYFLKALSSGGKDGEVAYSAFDTPVDTAPPAGADVLDLSKAGAGEGA
ncbi:hypothetical protein [Streptomyces sp. NBC_00503]|uniref:hypothetical protein n=1 Tax=Streptomyces sp. NBC_00503 TaxID=2903659 RepID=UPI002E823249|nr:hypothetical protein [Streptomyces sp. NBC_00503]WUD81684.1 hypothetical protein OG490_14700 [Streptomyces sp. NBC_00503]